MPPSLISSNATGHQRDTANPTTTTPLPPTPQEEEGQEHTMATMAMHVSPVPSPSSLGKRRHSPSLSLDLSDLPQLSQPSPPSNTLLITNLNAPEIFQAASLESIRAAINAHAQIHTFSPLKSFRRIIVTFSTIEDAVAIRQVLDGETVLGNRVRVYFGQQTKISLEDQHLQAPQSQKLFFISPPPSPPVGWEMRNEEPPNKDVHAEDLAAALANLHARPAADAALRDDYGSGNGNSSGVEIKSPISAGGRSRSSTIVFDPQEHGRSPDLPAIAVEDTTDSPVELSPVEGGSNRSFVHTARPPVELMEH